jgi:gliding motility-associated-like protein
MKLPRFQTLIVFALVLASSALLSQNNTTPLNSASPFAFNVFSLDSLVGFDEDQAKQNALSEGFYGQKFANAMIIYKRQFVINKYDLYAKYNDPQNFSTITGVNNRYGSAVVANAPCVNEDFETNTLAGWTASLGTNSGSQNYPSTPTSLSSGSLISVVYTPISDGYVGTIPASPFGGTKVAKINSNVTGAVVVKLSQTFSVTPTNYLYDFAYWAVMENPPNAHSCTQTPYMLIKIRDNAGILQSCPNFSIVGPSGGFGGCAGLGPTTWTPIAALGTTVNSSTGWQKFSIDLTSYITSPFSNVTIEVIVAGCSLTGHFGYAYFDSNCNTMNLTVNSQTLSMVSPTVFPQVVCGGTATMVAPSGLGPYNWAGPTGTSTSQTVVTTVPGNYSLTLNPPGICNPISKLINLQFVPPTTVTASPSNLCATGTNTSSSLSASGASNYTWAPGGSTLSTIVVSPTVTTIYTLSARTGTCVGIFTTQITVNPDPIVTVLSSNFTVCPGQTATLTAFGANSYAWSPGGLTGSLVTVAPLVTTTYTTVGTATTGCSGTATTGIFASAAIVLTLTPFSPTYNCAGASVNVVAGGATTFTWLPPNLTGFFQTLTPTVTTNYTVIGASGTCSNSANITLSVNPGPSITIAPNPATVCPGNSTTLTANAPLAIGNFTWAAPLASNAASVVVTPTLAGGYSVSAKDAMNCVSTFTANPIISPLPSLTISPSSPSICFGSSVTLSAGGAVSYTWLPGNINAGSISVSPTVNTTYTLIGANAAGCTVQAVGTVTVISLPVVNASASPSAVCAGSCATITPNGALTYTITGGSFVVCPLVNTNYSITGTDISGCTSTPVIVSVTANPIPTLVVSATPTNICQGASSTLSVTGATSYTWSTGSNANNVSVSPSVTTTYTVTGDNAFGCSSSQTIQVFVTPIPNVSITPTSPTVCAGSTLALSASGANSYTWNPGALSGANINVSPLVNTTYTVIGETAGCTGQNTVFVTVAPIPNISATASPSIICAGNCSTLSPVGATSYTFSSGSAVVCPTVNTSYTITGSNASGCIGNTVVVSVSVNAAPSVSASASPTAVCPGNSSNLSALGAISYTWLPMNVTGANTSVTPTATTVYTVFGANAFGCTTSQTVSVNYIPTPTVGVTASPTAICAGGVAALTATGASSYIWLPGSLSGVSIFVSPTVTTTYSVTGTSSGCSGSTVVTLLVNPLPTLSITSSPTAVCIGSSATLTANGAATYTWNTGSFVSNIAVSPTITTTYSLSGTSAAGCVGNTTQLTLPVNNLPLITAGATPTIICIGASANLTATGGTSYTWQPVNLNGASVIVTPTTLTTYTVSGQNTAGCLGTQTVQVNVSNPPALSISASVPSICAGSAVNLTASGGTSYTWQPGGSNVANITPSPPSTTTYTLFGSNAIGCVGQTTLTMPVIPNPVLTSSANPSAICVGASATLSAGGATSYTWSPNLNGAIQVVTPSVTTTYTVFGTAAGCSGSSSITIVVNPNPIVFGISSPTNICVGSSATLSGGGAVNYTWTPGSLLGANVVVSPTATTIYTVNGSTAAGCSASSNVTLVVSPLPTVSAFATASAICIGQSTSLTATGSGSTYSWNPGGLSGATIGVSPTVTTTYSVTSSLGICNSFTTITVVVNPLPLLTAFASPATICLGAATTLTANGAASYTWNPGALASNPVTVAPTSSTIYTVDALSAFGCTNSQTVSVTVNPIPSLSVTANSNPICSGNSATLTASGATSYSWNTGSNISTIIVNPPITTVYTVTGTNASACSSSVSYTLVINPSPTLNIVASSPSICAGFSVSLLATGAGSYTWNPGNTTNNPLLDTPPVTTIYTVTGQNGTCISTNTILITVAPLPSVSVVATPSAVCLGNTITLTANGAVTYSWIPSLIGGSTFTDTPLVATDYTVIGFDAVGCPNFATVNVNVLPNPTVTALGSSTAICIGNSATLSANGATNYTWQPGSLNGNTISVNPTSSTVYTVSGDNGACSAIATVSLVVNSLPIVSASTSNSIVCAGTSVSLTALGALNYTWTPTGLNGVAIVDNPLISTTYTVAGEDLNGCIGFGNVSVSVNPNPTLTVIASPTTICNGGSVNLSANGALTYTWSNNQTGAVITDAPSVSTSYSVTGTDANGCSVTETVLVNVVPIPTITIAPINPSICIGSSATLTANGAINYTWLPAGTNGSVLVTSPSVITTYTIVGDNGGNCSVTETVTVFVNPLPANVVASSTGTVGCTSPTAALFGISTDTNVSYSWSGPAGFSSGAQNATLTGVWGDFTLTVTDNATGCSATTTVNVPSDNTIPLITAGVSGSITCAVSSVTITALNTTTNAAYSWSGPSSFTSSLPSPTVSIGGNYTITVTDLSSTCSATAIVSVGVHTRVEATASITPATCTGSGTSNNDGKINVVGFINTDKYDIVGGNTYTGTSTYATAVNIPTNGIITNNLANPSTTVAYTIRLFDAQGCLKDTTLFLIPVNCSIKTLGIAKSASKPFTNSDGTYDVTFKVVAKNYDTGTLSNVSLTENLAATFAAANNFTVIGLPVISPSTSSLLPNALFNGTSQTNLLQVAGSSIDSGKADTISFTVRVSTSLFFTPFNNSVLGSASNITNQTVVDSSQAGLNPDPDNDLNPSNNNLPTAVSFTPSSFFGITKVGALAKADDKSFDISYTITVHNLGNDTLRDVSLADSLFESTIKNPASYTMRSGPVLSGTGLSVNAAYDGKDDIRLILPNQSKLAPNTISSISFVIRVVPGTITSISNSAFGSALRAKSATLFETVSDTSGNGTNPDINGNNVWNEPEDNVATVLLIPSLTQTLFIPEGFSPNGDNINDLFVIQGLPTSGNNSITFYNRWGTKVYENENYDNSWDGTSNGKGNLGSGKLPQGTYYYVLDMKNSGIKAISGFITLEY